MHGPGGFIVTTLLGIVGAIFASWLGQRIGWYAPGQNAGFIGAIVGAVLILAIYRAISATRADIGGIPLADRGGNRASLPAPAPGSRFGRFDDSPGCAPESFVRTCEMR